MGSYDQERMSIGFTGLSLAIDLSASCNESYGRCYRVRATWDTPRLSQTLP